MSATTFTDSSGEEEDESSFPTSSSSTFEITPCSSGSLPVEEPFKSDVEGSCCCVSVEDLAGDWMDLPFVGWEAKTSIPGSSSHCLSVLSQAHHGHGSVEGGSHACKASSSASKVSKSAVSKSTINLGSESRSSLRSYIHTAPFIPYTFHHHLGSDTSVYLEDYRNSYTYPNLGKSRKVPLSVPGLNIPATVKPTLYVLNSSLALRYPSHYKRQQVNSMMVTFFGAQNLYGHHDSSNPNQLQ